MSIAVHEIFALLPKAHDAHPALRLGQLMVVAASRAAPKADIFYVPDDELAAGLGAMIDDPQDGAADQAARINSYLARKVGATLDGETVDEIARIIRGSR